MIQSQGHRDLLLRLPDNLVIFDGECGLCDTTVQTLLRWDTNRVLRYTPNQGETFKGIEAQFGPLDASSTVYFLEKRGQTLRLYERSRAVFQLCSHLTWPYRALSWLRIIPRFITDSGYRLVSRYRLKIWGTVEACRLPAPDERALFLP